MPEPKQHKRWLMLGALGAILFGTGFSLAAESSYWKHSGEPLWLWMGGGTLGIGLMISGIVTFINAKKYNREDQ